MAYISKIQFLIIIYHFNKVRNSFGKFFTILTLLFKNKIP